MRLAKTSLWAKRWDVLSLQTPMQAESWLVRKMAPSTKLSAPETYTSPKRIGHSSSTCLSGKPDENTELQPAADPDPWSLGDMWYWCIRLMTDDYTHSLNSRQREHNTQPGDDHPTENLEGRCRELDRSGCRVLSSFLILLSFAWVWVERQAHCLGPMSPSYNFLSYRNSPTQTQDELPTLFVTTPSSAAEDAPLSSLHMMLFRWNREWIADRLPHYMCFRSSRPTTPLAEGTVPEQSVTGENFWEQSETLPSTDRMTLARGGSRSFPSG